MYTYITIKREEKDCRREFWTGTAWTTMLDRAKIYDDVFLIKEIVRKRFMADFEFIMIHIVGCQPHHVPCCKSREKNRKAK